MQPFKNSVYWFPHGIFLAPEYPGNFDIDEVNHKAQSQQFASIFIKGLKQQAHGFDRLILNDIFQRFFEDYPICFRFVARPAITLDD